MSTQSLFSPGGHSKIDGMGGLGAGILKLPCTFATADAAILLTVPDSHYLLVRRCFWLVTTAWTGGTNAAIGASSSNAAYNTKGDLQGGSGGDLLAALTAGWKKGSAAGAKFASNGLVILAPGDTIRFDRVVDVFTAGAGYLCVDCSEVTDAAT